MLNQKVDILILGSCIGNIEQFLQSLFHNWFADQHSSALPHLVIPEQQIVFVHCADFGTLHAMEDKIVICYLPILKPDCVVEVHLLWNVDEARQVPSQHCLRNRTW
jgi:hypothetical protein